MRKLMESLLLAGTLFAVPAWAQNETKPGLELAVTYSALRTNPVEQSNFWMNGGSFQMEGRFYHGLGAVADVSGFHASNVGPSAVDLNIITATFGPRYTWQFPHRRLMLFGEGLLGEANGFNSLFPGISTTTGDATSLAVQVGGGMNLPLSSRISFRAFEADWMRTQLPNSTTNVQNSLRLSAGVVFHVK